MIKAILIFYIPIGNLAPDKVVSYMKECAKNMGVKVLKKQGINSYFFPSRKSDGPKVEVISFDGKTKVFPSSFIQTIVSDNILNLLCNDLKYSCVPSSEPGDWFVVNCGELTIGRIKIDGCNLKICYPGYEEFPVIKEFVSFDISDPEFNSKKVQKALDELYKLALEKCS